MSSPEVIPTAEVPPPSSATTVVTPAPRPAAPAIKSPWVALLLSLVMPGLGQVYNGQIARALTFFVAFSGSIYLITENNPLPFAIFLPFIIFANMIDAYRSATLINMRGVRRVEENEAESPWWGASLAAMGLLLFLNNMGWLHLSALVRYWPILLIAAGIVLLRRSIQARPGNGASV